MQQQNGFLRQSALYATVLLIVGFMTLHACGPRLTQCLESWNDNHAPSWTGALPGKERPGERVCDIDTRLIHGGLMKAPTFPDTFRWWSGTWAGQVPFYRPLTSYVFWTQWQIWGDYENRYHIVAIAFHFAAVLSLVRFARLALIYFGIPLPDLGALLTGMLFVRGAAILPSQETVTGSVFSLWKNQPDSLTLLFFTLSLSAYIKNIDASGSKRAHWQTIAPTFYYLLMCLTKEAGIFLPLLLPLLEINALRHPQTRRAAVHRLLPLLCLLPLYLGVRFAALDGGMGYRYGSNGAWVFRLLSSVAGNFSEAIVMGDVTTLCVTGMLLTSLGWIWYLTRRGMRFTLRGLREMALADLLRLCAGLAAAATFAALIVACYLVRTTPGAFDPAQAVVQLFLPQYLERGTSAALYLLCMGYALWRRPGFGVFCYAWGLLTLGLTLFSPSPLHRYYLMNAAFALLLPGGALLWVSSFVERTQQRGSAQTNPEGEDHRLMIE